MLSVNQLSADRPNCNKTEAAMTRQKVHVLATRHFFLWLLHPSWRPEGGDKAKTIYRLINKKMAKLLFNRVLLENDFVLEPSNENKNQRLVSYPNLIHNLMVEARISNYLDEDLFLIANLHH